jgi:hypothetical protein
MRNIFVFEKYIKANKTFVIAIAYFFFSIILKTTSGINICFPCFWKSVFGFDCPGCGITTSFIYLLKLDFTMAIQSNWLILIIVPFVAYYMIQDYFQFFEKQNTLAYPKVIRGSETIKIPL